MKFKPPSISLSLLLMHSKVFIGLPSTLMNEILVDEYEKYYLILELIHKFNNKQSHICIAILAIFYFISLYSFINLFIVKNMKTTIFL